MRCDLHCHTSYSYDSTTSPRKIVEAAISKKIDCLAITDHSEIEGASEAAEYAEGKSILIIPGIEIKSKDGDILGLNIKKIIPKGLPAEETIKRIKEAGGMVIIPHPFAWFYGFKGDLKKLINNIDGIEVLNASIFGTGNKTALKFAQKYNLSFTAGSDAHETNFIGKAFLEIPGNNLSIEEVLKSIRNKNGRIIGKAANFFEKIIAHTGRSIAKLQT